MHQLKRLKELETSMSTIAATRRYEASQHADAPDDDGFDLSTLDYDALIDVYGDDPVLLTILNRMRKHFTRRNETWFRFKDWPASAVWRSEPYKWDSTLLSTTSTVSDPFTVKFEPDGTMMLTSSTKPEIRYSIEED